MLNEQWCMIDTETTGLRAPIFVVEIAAQRMVGWEPDGPAFRRLINHGADIPPEASRVHGYTREILERDGDDPKSVYADFANYVRNFPVCAYNLKYDWDEVLVPEWRRLEIKPVGMRGFCVYELTKRLLDPVPAGNCKLQTLRQYYELPSRGAHTALGDIETAIDLFKGVLQPLCRARGLNNMATIGDLSESQWFPSRLAFGKFKGRYFKEARTDKDFFAWLQWLAESNSLRSSIMGKWYLQQLLQENTEVLLTSKGTALAPLPPIDTQQLILRVEQSRNRLAELEADYTSLKQKIAVTQARLFQSLAAEYEQRDLLQLRLQLRRKYLETLLYEGEEEAQPVETQRAEEEEKIEANYKKLTKQAIGRRELDQGEALELKQLWRKLVRLFHPDLADSAKQTTHDRLTAEINRARDDGDLDRLREIARDPSEFISRQGWAEITLNEEIDAKSLQRMFESLQARLLEIMELFDSLQQSPEHQLHLLLTESPALFDSTVASYKRTLQSDISEIKSDLSTVEIEINALLT